MKIGGINVGEKWEINISSSDCPYMNENHNGMELCGKNNNKRCKEEFCPIKK